jgi:lactate permease
VTVAASAATLGSAVGAPVTVAAPLTAGAAALPVVVILVLMVGLRWSAARAGLVGAAVALGLAVGVFEYGREVLPRIGPIGATAGALSESVFTGLTILWIIGPALAIYHLQGRTGGTATLQRGLATLTDDPRIVVLLVAWFFALFMEGAAGFGASVALAAPFLVDAGFDRVRAVTTVLVGHAVGVSFGAVGTPIIPQVAATGFTGAELARATAPYHALLGWIPLLITVAIASRDRRIADQERSAAGWVVLAALLFLGPYALLGAKVGPELPTLGGALLGGLVFVGVLRWRTGGAVGKGADRAGMGPDGAAPGAGRLLRAGSPYLVLVAAVLVTRLVPPVTEALTAVVWRWEFAGTFTGSIQPLYHPGTMLVLGLLGGVVLQGAGREQVGDALRATAGQLWPVTVALLAMLFLSRLMFHAGMIETLAQVAAASAGVAWPVIAPFVGVLGTFVTGSATASNILFTELQRSTADELGFAALTLLGAQGFGAAVGNIICPHNIVAAGATVDLSGREGEILRRTLPVALVYALAGGLLAAVFVL